MSYSARRQQYAFPLAPTRNNAAVIASFAVPASKTIEVYDLKAYMSTAGSAAGCAVDLKQDGGSALMTVTTANSTGAKATASSRPIAVTGAASTGSKLELIQNTTDTTGIGTVVLDMDAIYT